MCRNIKPLFNYEPAVTDADIEDAALQFVRKVSGYRKPSQVNEKAFITAVNEVAAVTHKLLQNLDTKAPARDRKVEIEKSRTRFNR